MKKVLVLGGDGYLGWSTALSLSKDNEVMVVDNYLKRKLLKNLKIKTLINVPELKQRSKLWYNNSKIRIKVKIGDVSKYSFISKVIKDYEPHSVIHFAEQPSAPFSMLNQRNAELTVQNNLLSTLNLIFAVKDFNPECHIIKLGTMGEYGTPNIDIEEGFLDLVHKGRKDKLLFPKTPGSIYHLSKVNDSDLMYFATRIWNIRVTDLNQGPVYGVETFEENKVTDLYPMFNYDSIFGTVLNRFIVQAVEGFPLTVYGKGGQKRGYLNIIDTIQCIKLAIKNSPKKGIFRVMNQFTETFTVNELASKVQKIGNEFGLKVKVKKIRNPRKELEEHYYNPKNTNLMDLGLKPNLLNDEVIKNMINFVYTKKKNINRNLISPNHSWNVFK